MPDTEMLSLLAKYDQRLPRYTSYPTAPHFAGEVDADIYERWLKDLPETAPASVYLHVPFCAQLCWYCGCNTAVVNGTEPISEYAVLLRREIGMVAGLLGRRLPVGSVHWGGGTPTMLSDRDFRSILDGLRAHFRLAPTAEISVELDPRGLTRTRVRQLFGEGVNRVSLGVQDFEPAVQRAINRIQPYAQTEQAVDWLRQGGIDKINFDLMYGLPFQTVESIGKTVDRAVDLLPGRIALFGYAHVPWMKRHQALLPADALPGMAERFDQAEAAALRLETHGYVRIGLDHFARPDDELAVQCRTGGLARNFQGYTTDQSPILLGFGASAIGRMPQGFVQNTPDMPTYRREVGAGRLPVAKGIAFGGDDILRGQIIERLMCDLEVDLSEVARNHDREPERFLPELARLDRLIADGLVRRNAWRLNVTPRGRPLVRAIAAVFDAYLDRTDATAARPRHSRAI